MLIDIPGLRDKLHVFEDRRDAGCRLAGLLGAYKAGPAIVLALPVGGVPVAAAIAEKLDLPLDVAVVSKITLPWTTEAGFGAVAFDGTTILNDEMLPGLGLTDEQIQERIKQTAEKVKRRSQKLRADKPMPDLSGKTIILVDDGIASGITMQTAIKALGKLNPAQIIVAVPTAHAATLKRFIPLVKDIYCANVRRGFGFAVADTYKRWYDVDEAEAAEILQKVQKAQ